MKAQRKPSTGAYIKIKAAEGRFVAGIVRAHQITAESLTSSRTARDSSTGTFIDKYRRKAA